MVLANQVEAARQQARQLLTDAQIDFAVTDQAVGDAKVRERFRGQIALFVMWLFITVILAGVIYAIATSSKASEEINNLLQTYVYPVVLLVLGFYFGTRQDQDAEGGDDA